jgi:hypothetical protein
MPKEVWFALGALLLLCLAATSVRERGLWEGRMMEREVDLQVLVKGFEDCRTAKPGYVPGDCSGWQDAYFALRKDQQLRDFRR